MTAAAGPASATGWARWLPILSWLPTYQRAWLTPDLIATLTTWALVVPQAIAYSSIAGLPPEAGLAAAVGGLLAYGLLGTSRQLIVSPTSSTAAISASIVAAVVAGDAARTGDLSAALAILTGLAFVVFGVLRLGFVARFIPTPVQVGFMFGLGITIMVGQVGKMLGVSAGSGTAVEQVRTLVGALGDTNAWSLGIGIAALVALMVVPRVAPRLPVALVVIVVAIVAVAVLGLADRGVAVIGVVQGGLPQVGLPQVGLHDLNALVPGALAIALVGCAESLTVAEQFAQEHRQEIRPDQELVANGGANVLAGVLGGFIVGGGASQSAANDRAGARTNLVSILLAGLVLLTMVALLPLFHDLPDAVLAAIVIAAVSGFLRVGELVRIRQARPSGFWIALFALVATLALGILPGLIAAVILALLVVLVRLARPPITELVLHPDGRWGRPAISGEGRPVAGTVVLRPGVGVLFLNAGLVRDHVTAQVTEAAEPPQRVVLDLSLTPDIDIESVDMLRRLHARLAADGVELVLVDLHQPVREMFRRVPTAGSPDPRFEADVAAAVRDRNPTI